MAKNKHLSLTDIYDIEKYLNQGFNFSEIGRLFSYLFQIILTDNDSEFIIPDPLNLIANFLEQIYSTVIQCNLNKKEK